MEGRGERSISPSQLAHYEADNADPAWHSQFSSGSGRNLYEYQCAALLAQLQREQARREGFMRELEQAKMDTEGSSKEVKTRREERLWSDGVGE